MTRQDVGSLALRVVGLYALILAIGMLVPGLVGLAMWIKMALADGADAATTSRGETWQMAVYLVTPFLFIALAIVLIHDGRRLALRLFRDPEPDAASDGGWTLIDAQGAAFAVLGAYIAFEGLRESVPRITNLLQHEGEIFHALDFVVFSGPAAFLLIGATLFFRGRRLSAFWHRMDRRDLAGAATEPSGPISS